MPATLEKRPVIKQDKHRAYEAFGASRILWSERHAEEILIEGPTGTGKAQPLDAVIQTPKGPIRMGDVRIGTEVCTPDGYSANVIGIFPQGRQKVYRVDFTDGSHTEVTSDHLWRVISRDSGRVSIRRTAQLKSGYKHCIPQHFPVYMEKKEVFVDPYLIGLLIGDGYLRKAEVSIASTDPEILDSIRAMGHRLTFAAKCSWRIYAGGQFRRKPLEGCVHRHSQVDKWYSSFFDGKKDNYLGIYTTRIEAQAAVDAFKSSFTDTRKSLRRCLYQLGLEGKRSHNKFVPDLYKYNCAEVRWAVVQGLMDTDGTVDHKSGAPSYCTTSARLAQDFRWLIQSLGGICRISVKKTTHRDAYNCSVTIDQPDRLFRLSRKKILAHRSRPVTRYVQKVTQVGVKECQCISIDAENGLYLTDEFIVTHNTRSVAEKAHYLCLRYAGCRILFVRKTRESLTESVLVTFEEKVLPPDFPMKSQQQRNIRQSYRYPNGSVIVIGGMDKSSRIMSTEYDMICVFEATELSEEDFENLTTRLRNGVIPYSQIIADCNPGVPHHWLNKRASKPFMLRLKSRLQDNPMMFDQVKKKWTPAGIAYRGKMKRLSGARRLRLFKGVWAVSEGMVYKDWDETVHIKDKKRVKPHWRKIRVVDFGYNHPFVCQWWAIDDDGVMWMYREIFMTQKTVSDHAQVIKHYSDGENIEATICDHDREGRATLEQEGIWTIPAYKDVERGIEAVEMRMRINDEGRTKMYFMRDTLIEEDETLIEAGHPTKTVDEIPGYVYGRNKEGKIVKEEPLKELDDGCDTMRYAVAYVDNLAGMNLDLVADGAQSVEATEQNAARDVKNLADNADRVYSDADVLVVF